VRLKSGGPKMTVAGYNTLGVVICQWFVGPQSNQQSGRNQTALTRIRSNWMAKAQRSARSNFIDNEFAQN
jgi:uncharacterized protein YodC (DUF2158 family)